MESKISEAIGYIVSQQEIWLEFMLREKVTPPIRGEITKGKIRWRGLTIMHYPNNIEANFGYSLTYDETIRLEQRGRVIEWTEEEFKEWKIKNQKI